MPLSRHQILDILQSFLRSEKYSSSFQRHSSHNLNMYVNVIVIKSWSRYYGCVRFHTICRKPSSKDPKLHSAWRSGCVPWLPKPALGCAPSTSCVLRDRSLTLFNSGCFLDVDPFTGSCLSKVSKVPLAIFAVLVFTHGLDSDVGFSFSFTGAPSRCKPRSINLWIRHVQNAWSHLQKCGAVRDEEHTLAGHPGYHWQSETGKGTIKNQRVQVI